MYKNTQTNIDIFQDTLSIIKNDKTLKEQQEVSRKNTKLYKSDENIIINDNHDKEFQIFINNERSFEAAYNLKGKTAVLNFASGTCPGGGVKKGSPAQEECLCRISTLYNCLTTNYLNREFYLFHKNLDSYLFSDNIIYSPDVVVIKSDTKKPISLSPEERYKVNVISSAAPKLKGKDDKGRTIRLNVNEDIIFNCMKNRIRQIIKVAIYNKNINIVLGAFGCGAYFNNPNIVARAFKEILIDEGYASYFLRIIFAILSTKDDENIRIFKSFFNNYL